MKVYKKTYLALILIIISILMSGCVSTATGRVWQLLEGEQAEKAEQAGVKKNEQGLYLVKEVDISGYGSKEFDPTTGKITRSEPWKIPDSIPISSK